MIAKNIHLAILIARVRSKKTEMKSETRQKDRKMKLYEQCQGSENIWLMGMNLLIIYRTKPTK